MAEDVPVVHGTPVSVAFFQALQQMMSGAWHNLKIEQLGTNQLRVPAGPGDQQVSISIGGPTEERALYRWITAPVTVTVTGAAGIYDIFACAAEADKYTSEKDETDRRFTLASVTAGKTPTGVYASRRIASVVFDGTYITQFIPQLGQLGNPMAQLASAIIPAGVGPIPWSGSEAPEGWLLADGTAKPIASYPALYDAIGTTYNADYEAVHGKAPPAGEFALPDGRGRTMVYPDNMGAAGAAGRLITSPKIAGQGSGEEKHTLLTSEVAVHNHPVTDPGHAHNINDPGHIHPVTDPGHAHNINDPGHSHTPPEGDYFLIGPSGGDRATTANPTGGATAAWSHTASSFTGVSIVSNDTFLSVATAKTNIAVLSGATGVRVGNAGGGASHNNMQPYLVVRNAIIKA